MTNEDTQKSRLEEYIELSKNSLVRVQYSCTGNDNSIDEEEFIPIVNSKAKTSENETKTKNS